MFKDYARCVYFESQGNPLRAARIASGLLKARIKHDFGPFHYSFFRLADTLKKEWGNYVRERDFTPVLRSVNLGDIRNLLNSKAQFHQHCLRHRLPTPPITCLIGKQEGALSSENIPCVDNQEQWKEVMESAPTDLFVKPLHGAHGGGVFAIGRRGQHFVFGQPEVVGSLEDLYRYILDKLKDETTLLVQPRMRSHSRLLDISSASGLATVRVVTAMVNNAPRVLYACVKLPGGKNIIDNFLAGSTGNLAAAVDVETGALSAGWYSARTEWPVMRSTDVHPNTGHRIRGTVLPLWSDVADLALRAQNSFPGLKTIGWDVAVTDDGAMLIEGNHTYAIELLEVVYQRGLGNELIPMIAHETNPPSA